MSLLVDEQPPPAPRRSGVWILVAVVFSLLAVAYLAGTVVALLGWGPYRSEATLGFARQSDRVRFSSRQLLDAAQAHRREMAVVSVLWTVGWLWLAVGALRRAGVLATPEPQDVPVRSIRWAAIRLGIAVACLVATLVAVALQLHWSGRF